MADHAEANPALHSTLTLVPAAIEPVAAFQHTDAAFTAGPPFLPIAKPAFLLFPFPFVALCAAIGNADALHSLFVRRLFAAGGVEAGIARDQARHTSQLFLV